jgi:hypothetical protein
MPFGMFSAAGEAMVAVTCRGCACAIEVFEEGARSRFAKARLDAADAPSLGTFACERNMSFDYITVRGRSDSEMEELRIDSFAMPINAFAQC